MIRGMEDTKKKRAMLNTTIRQDVMDNFRNYCKAMNCPMNMVLEAFMTQFSNGEFVIKLGKNKVDLDLED